MKSRPKSASPQLNLALLDRAPAELPPDEAQELSRARIELLLNAAPPRAGQQRSTGGQNAFETYE